MVFFDGQTRYKVVILNTLDDIIVDTVLALFKNVYFVCELMQSIVIATSYNLNDYQIQALLSLSSAIRLFLLSTLVYIVVGRCGCGKGVPMDSSAGTSHWPIDGSMLVQLLWRWYSSMVECLLFAGSPAPGTVKAVFFTIILFYRI